MRFVRSSVANVKMPAVLNLSPCILVQVKKEALLEDQLFAYVAEFLVPSVDLIVTDR